MNRRRVCRDNGKGGTVNTRIGLKADWTQIWTSATVFVTLLFLSATAWTQSTTESGKAAATRPEAIEGLLDGRQFKAGIVRVEEEPEDTKPPLVDQLSFSNGMFSSTVCRRYNFAEAPYWVRVEDDKIHFLAELTSPTDGKMLWKGTIRGGVLEGTMRWTKKRWYWTIDTEHKIRGEIATGSGAVSVPPK